MGIRDRPISPRSPWQNGHVEPPMPRGKVRCSDVGLPPRRIQPLKLLEIILLELNRDPN